MHSLKSQPTIVCSNYTYFVYWIGSNYCNSNIIDINIIPKIGVVITRWLQLTRLYNQLYGLTLTKGCVLKKYDTQKSFS